MFEQSQITFQMLKTSIEDEVHEVEQLKYKHLFSICFIIIWLGDKTGRKK